MRKILRKKPTIILLIILAIGLIGAGAFAFFSRDNEEETSRILTEIPGWGYTLTNRHTDLYADLFNELAGILDGEVEEVDREAYASQIAKMFVVDFYDLDSKMTNTDIGGLEFIFPEARDNFILNAENTMYKNIENKLVNKERTQKLPIVNNVELVDIEETEFTLGDETTDAFKVSVKWSYKEDLGYDTEATMFIISVGKKLYIVEFNMDEE
jgi:hypothetical protein